MSDVPVGDDLAAVLAALRAVEETSRWLDGIQAAGDPPLPLPLPNPAELPALLDELGLQPEDAADLIASLAILEREPVLWAMVQRCAWSIVERVGEVGDYPPLPRWPDSTGVIGGAFYAWVYLASLPFARRYHAERGIPADVSRATFTDLGRTLRHGRRQRDALAVADPYWLALHLRGAIFELGRLQFERGRLGTRSSAALRAAGVACDRGDPVLSIHIPAFSGPMDPAACDASIAWAVPFFRTHVPEEEFTVAVCYSWMLDDDLRIYLPPTANIIRFIDRFHPIYRFEENDATILRFVFGRSDLPLHAYPQTTTLERAVISHIRSGHHWHGGAGWFRMPSE